MELVFPFVLLGLAVGLLIWGVSNLSVEGRYTKTLRHQCHGCRRGGAGLVFHDVWERWSSVCSFLGTSSRRTVALGADQSRCGAATCQNLRRDSDGTGNGPPALGDQRGSEWTTSSPALRSHIITEVSEAIGWGAGFLTGGIVALVLSFLGKTRKAGPQDAQESEPISESPHHPV